MKKLLSLTFALLFSGSAWAADNAVIVTPGIGVTMKSKDIGAGVQAMQPIPSDATGTPYSSSNVFQVGAPSAAIKSGAFSSGALASGSIASGAVASGAFASGALASGSVASGAMVDLGAQADSAAAGDTSTASLIALIKRNNQNLTTLNTTAGAALAAGTAVIGKVGIDQTTPGTTNGVQLAASLPAGTNIIGYISNDPCSSGAKTNLPISFQTTTLTQIIAASGSTKIYICSLSLIASGATVFSLSGGTGSNCASNQLGILGVAGTATHGLSLAANGGLTLGNGVGTVASTAASSELCIVQSGAGDISGNLTFVQQ